MLSNWSKNSILGLTKLEVLERLLCSAAFNSETREELSEDGVHLVDGVVDQLLVVAISPVMRISDYLEGVPQPVVQFGDTAELIEHLFSSFATGG